MTTTDALPPAILLMGPTASGKTELAIALAKRLPVSVVSVDSVMVYRGMDIGTAKPSADLLARVPHRLINILDPAEAYSVARFRTQALHEMQAITATGRIPLLVGGTMLYFRALQQGLATLPGADARVRAALERDAAEQGWAALHARLAEVDPVAAARIHPNDPQRIQRALEVYRISGVSLTDWYRRSRAQADGVGLDYRTVKLVVAPPERGALHERIARRFQHMLAAGFLDEVACLQARGDLCAEMASMRAVGYRQAWAHLAGESDHATMVQRAVSATRQLAKRQFTWLRAESRAVWFDAGHKNLHSQVLKALSGNHINSIGSYAKIKT